MSTSLLRLLLSVLVVNFFVSIAFAQGKADITINAQDSKHNISRHIYGHFSEHLGRCIYDGFWVADTMQVSKQGRIRLDVVEALKKNQGP